MAKGIINYDADGNPICEICGKSFKRVISHVRQKHDLSEREYKLQFRFDLKKGICSKESAETTRVKTLVNYDKCIAKNLMVGGEKSRFKDGSKGRNKEQVSEQTMIMLKEKLKHPNMDKARLISGSRLGKSGLGNKARWGTKNISGESL